MKELHTATSLEVATPAGSVSRVGALPVHAVFGESALRGRMVRERAIRENLNYLGALESLLDQAGSYAALLSGESHASDGPVGQLRINSKKVLNGLGLLDRSYLSFGGALAGPDYNQLKAEHPNERYKFYSSFALTSTERTDLGARWFMEVAQRCHEQGLSLTAKSFDHAYDSLNLYTWHPAELAKIIQELYPKYEARGLYYATPHFFQGSLEGINPQHVGFVQEPISGWPPGIGRSHSGRMRVLGEVLDSYGGRGANLGIEHFVEAASMASVDSARPYLIAA